MKLVWTVCYSTVTPESAECGDFDDCGWLDEYGYTYSSRNDESAGNLDAAKDGAFDRSGTLRDFMQDVDRYRIFARTRGDATRWFEGAPDIDYSTGEETTYTIHLGKASNRHFARISRYLAGRR